MYDISHLELDPTFRNHLTMESYEGGHMMYLYQPSLIKLKNDLAQFIKRRLEKNTQ